MTRNLLEYQRIIITEIITAVVNNAEYVSILMLYQLNRWNYYKKYLVGYIWLVRYPIPYTANHNKSCQQNYKSKRQTINKQRRKRNSKIQNSQNEI